MGSLGKTKLYLIETNRINLATLNLYFSIILSVTVCPAYNSNNFKFVKSKYFEKCPKIWLKVQLSLSRGTQKNIGMTKAL